MDILALCLTAALGLLLGLGGRVAIWTGKKCSRRCGFWVWVALVAAPATLAGAISAPLLLFALPLGGAFSGAMLFARQSWKQRLPAVFEQDKSLKGYS